jgi:hypothetical protein
MNKLVKGQSFPGIITMAYKIFYGPNFMTNFSQVELKLAKCAFLAY